MSSFPQLGQAWAVGGVWYEVLPLDEVDPEEEGYVLLPASGGQPARAVTMQRVRFCTDQRLGVCKLGDKCPKSHDPAVMAKENKQQRTRSVMPLPQMALAGLARTAGLVMEQRIFAEPS